MKGKALTRTRCVAVLPRGADADEGRALFQVGGFDVAEVETSGLLALLWWGAGTLALATLLMYSGMQTASGSIASAFTGVMPVSALVLSYVLLGEPFRWLHLVGFAAVLASIVIMAYANERQAAEERSPASA